MTGHRGLPDFTITRATAMLVFGNLLDAVFTLVLLQLDVVREMNPLMRWAYEASPISFVAAKLAMVTLGVVLLCFHRQTAAARLAEEACGILYGSLMLVHVAFIAYLALASGLMA